VADVIERREVRLDPTAKFQRLIIEGAIGGVIAGVIFAVAEMITMRALGGSVGTPWILFATVLLGPAALEAGLTVGVWFAGFFVHFLLSAVFGSIWGLIAGLLVPRSIRDSWGAHTGAAAIFGLFLYIVNFRVLATLVFPWFLAAGALGQILIHVFALGLPLGLWLTARARPIDRRVEQAVRA